MSSVAQTRTEQYHVSVDEYVRFREQGYLVVKGLVSPAEIAELVQHTENLRQGTEIIEGVPLPPAHLTPEPYTKGAATQASSPATYRQTCWR